MRVKKDYSKSKEANRRMAYSIDVVVLELKPDFDPFGGEYVFVSFGYKQAIPFAPPKMPMPMDQMTPKQISYKHALHILIPKEEWKDQYSMFQEFHLIVHDDGSQELKKK